MDGGNSGNHEVKKIKTNGTKKEKMKNGTREGRSQSEQQPHKQKRGRVEDKIHPEQKKIP